MKKNIKIWTVSIMILFIAACIREKSCEAIVENGRNVSLNYDWNFSNCVSDSVVVVITASSGETKEIKVPAQGGTFHLPEGTYLILSYEKVQGVVVEGDIARVETLPNGILAEPGEFSAGTGCIVVKEDELCRCNIVMKNQFNRLSLSLAPEGKDVDMLKKIEGKLKGVSPARNIRNNCVATRSDETTPSEEGTVMFDLEQRNGSFAGNVKFLGAVPQSRQILALTMVYTDDSRQTVEVDVTDNITEEESSEATSHANDISVGLQVEQIKGVVTAKITDWKINHADDLEAEENRIIKKE